ncbi:YciI family protein [Chitinophagaceae bacterium MMS25-I14]
MSKSLFIVMITYHKPSEEIDLMLENHKSFLDKHYQSGRFICSGRMNPRTGGIILCHGSNKPEIADLLTEDPFFAGQLGSYEIVEFIPSGFSDAFKALLDELSHAQPE